MRQLEALLTECAPMTQTADAQSRFMDHLHGQARAEIPCGVGCAGPATQQVPTAQSQVFRDQQPEPEQRAGYLVGQPLTDAALYTQRIGGFAADLALGPMGLDAGGRRGGRAACVEPFF